jgi:serine/threonine-protein kinase
MKELGKYIIEKELGRGAMGIVYRAYDPIIKRTVALKTIKKDQLDEEERQEILRRFKQEAQAAGRLNHQNVVVIYDYGEDDQTAFIAMGFIEGRELKKYLDNNERFGFEDIIKIMLQILDALSYAHQNNIIHRDIKPANILLVDGHHVMITDFGIAKIESSDLTQIGTMMGTPNYMSPEQFMGQRVDGRSDLFSAGVILYQLLTGEKPFDGKAFATIMHKAIKVESPPPSDLNITVPHKFDKVVKKALQKKPEDRFQTAKEFAEALKDINNNISSAPQSNLIVDETMISNRQYDDFNATVFSGSNRASTSGKNSKSLKASSTAPLRKKTGDGQDPFVSKNHIYLIVALILVTFAILGVWIRQTPIKDAKQNEPVTALQTTASTLFLKTMPPGATVYLNGKALNPVTPMQTTLAQGTYDLRIRKSGYHEFALALEVEENTKIPFTVTLTPESQ